jgi:hypothetical protein
VVEAAVLVAHMGWEAMVQQERRQLEAAGEEATVVTTGLVQLAVQARMVVQGEMAIQTMQLRRVA